jgi:hypothetical protein
MIFKNGKEFFFIFTILFSKVFVSKKLTILLKISHAQVAPLTHFILLASLFHTQIQIKYLEVYHIIQLSLKFLDVPVLKKMILSLKSKAEFIG